MRKVNGQEHWTQADYKKHKEKNSGAKGKYRNKKCEVNGIVFDSKKEMQYYGNLLMSKRAGEIKDFELQPSFVLQEGFNKDGVRHRPITYKADFKIIHNDGKIEIVDVKGFKTEVFKIKMKLFEYKFPEYHLVMV